MQISESKEKYIQAIYQLSLSRGYVLAVDVAEYLNYSRSSVSIALKELLHLGIIENGPHNEIYFTEDGRNFARKLHTRYLFFYNLLVRKGLEEQTAQNDAKKLMLAISEEGFQKLQ